MTDTTTETKPARFALDETKARALIARALRRYQSGEDGGAPGYETLSLPPAWDYMMADQEDNAADLVYTAGQCGAIVAPDKTDVALAYSDDGDGGCYQWQVTLPGYLRLATLWEDWKHLGQRDASGTARKAMEILREAVSLSNGLLNQLARHSAPRTVWVLRWSDRHNADETSVHASEDAAYAALACVVFQCSDAPPMDDRQAAAWWRGRPDCDYDITDHEIAS